MATTPCLLCRRPSLGEIHTAISANGMRLERIVVCRACAGVASPAGRCAVCREPVDAGRPAEVYEGVSASGHRLVRQIVCYPCAIPLGPQQGLTADLEVGNN